MHSPDLFDVVASSSRQETTLSLQFFARSKGKTQPFTRLFIVVALLLYIAHQY
jgi:hypothetical protein